MGVTAVNSTGWGKSRFTVLSTGNTVYFVLFINYYIICHTNYCKLTFDRCPPPLYNPLQEGNARPNNNNDYLWVVSIEIISLLLLLLLLHLFLHPLLLLLLLLLIIIIVIIIIITVILSS